MLRHGIMCVVALLLILATPAFGQDAVAVDRSATGGAQTLEDILARQRGEVVADDFRRDNVGNPDSAAGIAAQLGTRGGTSDPEVWRALRYGSADVTVSNDGPGASVLMQDGGMWWYNFRAGPLREYGGYLLLGMIGVLVLFYVLRGKIRVEHGMSGVTIQRFRAVERFGHWLLAGSFILLGVTGLVTLFGRVALIPLFGRDVFAKFALASKVIHNNVSWAFMLALIMIFVMWVAHNIPSRHDLVWVARAGGLFSRNSHPPARKFNAGQKIIFWAVILLGGSISVSGLSLLFPFEMPMFAPTFAKLNALGLPDLLGLAPLPEMLSPHEEMQYAQLWHASVSFVLMAIIIAHIYLGSVGMEGAYDAMGSGQVDRNWAREHHGLWVAEEDAKAKSASSEATPAE